MKIGIPKEIGPGETRVAVVPDVVSSLTRSSHEVFVETGAGVAASFGDAAYERAGATIITDPQLLYDSTDAVLKVQPPQFHPVLKKDEAELVREGSTYIGFMAPISNADVVRIFARRRITSFSMEYIPRITRAQSMDALSSMSTIIGYKAVLLASGKLDKMFPLLMTAAGTVPPAVVLILGAGVAGLQAIATAKRLGAKVEAFDPRPSVKEQVKSLGALFIEMELPEQTESAGGYALEQSPEFIKKEMEAIGSRLPKVDVVISTAQIFGKRAPLLMTAEMVGLMRHGSVIIDLAAETGGNCELTQAGKTVVHNGISILGPVNLAASVPVDASRMYAKNITTLFRHMFPKADSKPDFADEIVKGCCITHQGEVVNELIRKSL
ncbi:MAG: Re/Si-specific NAD(P)(+) transhydrogenase subunit alpha [Bacteroidota bacterium]